MQQICYKQLSVRLPPKFLRNLVWFGGRQVGKKLSAIILFALVQRVNSLEKILMPGKIEGKSRREHRG